MTCKLLILVVVAVGATPKTDDRKLIGLVADFRAGKDVAAGVDQYVRRHPEDGRGWLMACTIAEQKDDQDASFKACAKALSVGLARPVDRAKALTGLGVARRQQGKFEEALGYYRKALAEDPQSPNALLSMSVALLFLKRGAEALPYAQKAVTLGPDLMLGHAALACAYHVLGKPTERDAAAQKAIALGYDKKMLEAAYEADQCTP